MFKQQRFILRVLLCAVGLTSIFGLDKAWAMSWLGGEKIDAPLVKVSFCSGGDMLGSSHGLFVTAVDKEYALITYEDAEHHAPAYCKKGELLPGLITNPVSPAEMNNPLEVILGKITLNTYYYRETNLYARLSNGTDSVIKVKDNYALIKEGEPIKLLNDSIGQGERYIHPKYSEEFYIKLAKRLEAGNYTLNIDGYTTNFSIK